MQLVELIRKELSVGDDLRIRTLHADRQQVVGDPFGREGDSVDDLIECVG